MPKGARCIHMLLLSEAAEGAKHRGYLQSLLQPFRADVVRGPQAATYEIARRPVWRLDCSGRCAGRRTEGEIQCNMLEANLRWRGV